MLSRCSRVRDGTRDYMRRLALSVGAPTKLPRLNGFTFMHDGKYFVDLPIWYIWLGVSVELNQATADERIPLLLQTPAAALDQRGTAAAGPF